MPLHLTTGDPDFERAFAAFLAAKREVSEDVDAAVRAIIAQVRENGDKAVIELTRRFDRLDLAATGMRVTQAEIAAAVAACDIDTMAALELACARIESHHRRQLPVDDQYTDALGARLGTRWTAIESVGLYVPGGLASYPSSVLMNAVPARVAGVPRVAMVVPSPGGEMNPLVLAAAHLSGVSEIYRIGGAQAVAALAYGTQSVPAVAKIVGPGNAYVAAAKRQVFGVVGIDSIAGPSEVLVIADRNNDPEWLAADLLAQAEHDSAAQAILMTDDAGLAAQVEAAVARQLAALPRGNIAGASWETFGAVIVIRALDEAVP
ncbi:MAG: histidinol dehydrogenase, partial [Alphaproteobacteria bacterium]